jgi:hypothetical protein
VLNYKVFERKMGAQGVVPGRSGGAAAVHLPFPRRAVASRAICGRLCIKGNWVDYLV